MQEKQEMQDPSLGWEDPWSGKWQPTPVFMPGKIPDKKSYLVDRLKPLVFSSVSLQPFYDCQKTWK